MNKKIIVLSSILLVIAIVAALFYSGQKSTAYISGETREVIVYLDEDLKSIVRAIRGSEVEIGRVKKTDDKKYYEAIYRGNVVYILEENIVKNQFETVTVKNATVAIETILYKSRDTASAIISTIPAGSEFEVSRTYVDNLGNVSWYKYADGYILGSYVSNESVENNQGIAYLDRENIEFEDVNDRSVFLDPLAINDAAFSYFSIHNINKVIVDVNNDRQCNVATQTILRNYDACLNSRTASEDEMKLAIDNLHAQNILVTADVYVIHNNNSGSGFVDVSELSNWQIYADYLNELVDIGFDEIIIDGIVFERNDLDLVVYRTKTQSYLTYLYDSVKSNNSDVIVSAMIEESLVVSDGLYNADAYELALMFDDVYTILLPQILTDTTLGIRYPWSNPDLYASAYSARLVERLRGLDTSNITTLIQAYNDNTILHEFSYVDAAYINKEIYGMKNAGITGGFCLYRQDASDINEYLYLGNAY